MRKHRFWTLFTICLILVALFYVLVFPGKHVLGQASLVSVFEPLTSNQSQPGGCPFGDLVYGNYCVFSVHGEAERHTSRPVLLTLCTQGTVEFLHHVAVLCIRWSGPISVAVYSPAEDFGSSRSFVNTLRQCDSCINHWVTWHFFARKEHIRTLGKGSNESAGDCLSLCHRQRTRRQSLGSYPINVARNIARYRTRTPYVLSADIELYPSSGIPQKFQRMIQSSLDKAANLIPEVWVLPVFEVHAKFEAPRTKFQLKLMFEKKQAISFHKYRCNVCHMIPNLTQWMSNDVHMRSESNESLDYLRVWKTVKRSRNTGLQFWEPFFIGTKLDPEFDIRLSWEGKQNKMQMAYEMCMRNYNFHIVENAFLVHSPGINVYNASKEVNRRKYFRENNKLISVIKQDLLKIYGEKPACLNF